MPNKPNSSWDESHEPTDSELKASSGGTFFSAIGSAIGDLFKASKPAAEIVEDSRSLSRVSSGELSDGIPRIRTSEPSFVVRSQEEVAAASARAGRFNKLKKVLIGGGIAGLLSGGAAAAEKITSDSYDSKA